MSFDWGGHRKARWTRLCSEMLGGEQYMCPLTVLLNLDWRHSTSEKDIPEEDLSRGLDDHVWPLLLILRPRLVCALTNRVWKILCRKVEPLATAFARCPVALPREPIVFHAPGWAFPALLVKPHNHPSRALSYAQIVEMGKACRWFLNEPT